MNLLTSLEKQSKPYILFIGCTLVSIIGVIDFLTGEELAFSLFYVLPIALVTWLINRQIGLAASFVSALVWMSADLTTRHPYSHPLIPIWNTFIRLAFFVIITSLLSALRRAAEREKKLARTDYLTGAVNSRLFHELLQMEIDRTQRYERPFTLVYLDLDNFKTVNDQFGHSTGDQVLRTIVGYTQQHLRKVDVIARLGGDEFALLLPETNQESAGIVLAKLQFGLLQEMQQNNWAITFSIGALTCSTLVSSSDELLKKVDELMYSVKHGGKNAIKCSVYMG